MQERIESSVIFEQGPSTSFHVGSDVIKTQDGQKYWISTVDLGEFFQTLRFNLPKDVKIIEKDGDLRFDCPEMLFPTGFPIITNSRKDAELAHTTQINLALKINSKTFFAC